MHDFLMFNTCQEDIDYASKIVLKHCEDEMKTTGYKSAYDVLMHNYKEADHAKSAFVDQALHCIMFIRELEHEDSRLKDVIEISIVNTTNILKRPKAHWKYAKIVINNIRYCCKELITTIHESNHEAVRIYEKLGFERFAEMEQDGHKYNLYKIKGFKE